MRGLYVHLPFCAAKCPYCSFYSVSGKSFDYMKGYLDACLESASALDDRRFDTLYFGGGTPSHIPVRLLESFIEKLFLLITYSGAEFTVEANPESVSDDFAAFVKNSAVTRVSLGVQSFDDDVLRLLGRIHDGQGARRSVELLKNTGKALNLDMIYDIPNVTPQKIFDTAHMISGFEPQHVSAYSYSASDRGYLEGFDTDETLFEEIEDYFASCGIYKYETSNFAQHGFESLHNSIYWTMDEYIGIGAGAHSMFYTSGGNYVRAAYPADMEMYIRTPRVYSERDVSDALIGVKESLILGLRMKCGVDTRITEKRFAKINRNLLDCIGKLTEAGLLIWDGNQIKTTKRGALGLEYLSSSLWAV